MGREGRGKVGKGGEGSGGEGSRGERGGRGKSSPNVRDALTPLLISKTSRLNDRNFLIHNTMLYKRC